MVLFIFLRGLLYYILAGLFDYHTKGRTILHVAEQLWDFELECYGKVIIHQEPNRTNKWSELDFYNTEDRKVASVFIKQHWSKIRPIIYSHSYKIPWPVFPHLFAISLMAIDFIIASIISPENPGNFLIFATILLANWEDVGYYLYAKVFENRWVPDSIDLMFVLKKRWHLYLACLIGALLTIGVLIWLR